MNAAVTTPLDIAQNLFDFKYIYIYIKIILFWFLLNQNTLK